MSLKEFELIVPSQGIVLTIPFNIVIRTKGSIKGEPMIEVQDPSGQAWELAESILNQFKNAGRYRELV